MKAAYHLRLRNYTGVAKRSVDLSDVFMATSPVLG